MDSSSSLLSVRVGESWITVCDGVQHWIFLENEQAALPGGPCRDEGMGKLEERVRQIESILDDSETE